MTQTAKMCKELITQGLENLVQKEFREQTSSFDSSENDIRTFLNKLCVVEPIATEIMGEDMFRLTYILKKYGQNNSPASLDLSKLKKYKTEIFLDTGGFYNILVDNLIISYKAHLCPPSVFDIAISMWDGVYGKESRLLRRMYHKFLKTIEKELLME